MGQGLERKTVPFRFDVGTWPVGNDLGMMVHSWDKIHSDSTSILNRSGPQLHSSAHLTTLWIFVPNAGWNFPITRSAPCFEDWRRLSTGSDWCTCTPPLGGELWLGHRDVVINGDDHCKETDKQIRYIYIYIIFVYTHVYGWLLIIYNKCTVAVYVYLSIYLYACACVCVCVHVCLVAFLYPDRFSMAGF